MSNSNCCFLTFIRISQEAGKVHLISLKGLKECHTIITSLLLSHFSRVRLCATPQTAAHQAPLSLGFSRQERQSGLPFPSPMHESEKWKWSHSVMSDSLQPHGLQPTRLLRPWDFPGKSTGVGCHCLLQITSQFYPFLITLPKVLPSMTYFHHSTMKSKGLSLLESLALLEGSQKDFLGYSFPISVCICAQSYMHIWTLWLHGQQPTRLLCPQNFPGKNAGVVAISFSRGSSRPRDQTQVSCTGRQNLYHCATWEAPPSPDLRTCKNQHWYLEPFSPQALMRIQFTFLCSKWFIPQVTQSHDIWIVTFSIPLVVVI